MRRLVNAFVLALLTATVAAIVSHLTNQLPPIPNKEENVPKIIAALVAATLAAAILAVFQQAPGSDRARGTIVRGNRLIGEGNKLQVSQQNAEVSKNLLKGDEQSLIVKNCETSNQSQGKTP